MLLKYLDFMFVQIEQIISIFSTVVTAAQQEGQRFNIQAWDLSV